MKAKKSLGQHFLRSEKALREIVSAGEVKKNDVVLEIGPGEGVLTRELLKHARKVIAIEKDRALIPLLSAQFSNEIKEGKLQLLEADVLTFIPSVLTLSPSYKLIANIPYYITGAIIEQFLSAHHQPSRMVLLVQKEVAERIVAKDKKESVLSIAVKSYGRPRIIAKVPAGAFTPAPKIDSAILLVETISKEFFSEIDEITFFKLVKFIFGKKRGQLLGRLSDYLGNRSLATEVLRAMSIEEKVRPENVSLAQWKTLAVALSSHATLIA